MAIPHFLAMTSAEFDAAGVLSSPPGWMACHFSPYGTGLTNLPDTLPEGSLLILNDRTPMAGQSPEQIGQELLTLIEKFHCFGLLLDFQRPKTAQTEDLVHTLSDTLPCPVAAPPEYGHSGPIFLPPIPVDVPPEQHLAPWCKKAVWLELSAGGMQIALTPEGAEKTPANIAGETPLRDEKLCCHYRMDIQPERIRFLLKRTAEDLDDLLKKTQPMGVTAGVGLYQELGKFIGNL